MASNEQRINRFDFNAWAGVAYIVDDKVAPDQFFCDGNRVFHIGAGTDLHLRLFYLNLTVQDLRWLKDIKISLGNQ